MTPGGFLGPEIGPLRAQFPGSVQRNLRDAGLLPDWNDGLNSRTVEWVEHRHWCFAAMLPAGAVPAGATVELHAETLDHAGWVVVDGRIAGEFCGALGPVTVDLTAVLAPSGPHHLALVFDSPPDEQGQLGRTSLARTFKPRFSYGWDWGVRFVPIGARGRLELAWGDAPAVTLRRVRTTLSAELQSGELEVVVDVSLPPGLPARAAALEIELRLGQEAVLAAQRSLAPGTHTLRWTVTDPALWWPAGTGPATCYELRVRASLDGEVAATWSRVVGFRHVAWQRNPGAPAEAAPWLAVVNGRALFLQGVNWTPVRLDYLAVQPEEIASRVATYRTLGCNLLRVWGGAGLEVESFYEACDRDGLLVWQEFPLSSSGIDSVPPEDAELIRALTTVARHYVAARLHHPSLLLWCGGNELHRTAGAADKATRVPLEANHPALAALARVVADDDPDRRFVPTSPDGPRFHATRAEFGRGLHHAVHGPWNIDGFAGPEDWANYWRDDDALFRTEVGVPGASPAALIRRHAGGEAIWPPQTPYWRHTADWWTQWRRLEPTLGSTGPDGLEQYVTHTQREQADHLATAARLTKARFPACGGFVVWMGHDAFPCPSNLSLLDFDGVPKPAAQALAAVFRSPAG